jgi:hypothetical protein
MENQNETSVSSEDLLQDFKFDQSVKRILSYRRILAWILHDYALEFAGFDIETIMENIEGVSKNQNPRVLGENTQARLNANSFVEYDMYIRARIPDTLKAVMIDLEGQKKLHPGYSLVTRGIVNLAAAITIQKGIEYTGTNYNDLIKVYSVWILLNPARKTRGYWNIWAFQPKEKDSPLAVRKELYDKMDLILIALGDEKAEDKDIKATAANLLTVVFSSHKSIEEKRRILKEKFGFQPDELFESEVNTMFHYSEVYLERGMKMERAKTQEILKRSMKRGIERGREMERASMQETLKREREQTKLEKEKARLEMEKHRLENEKHAKKLQTIAIALHQNGLSIEEIASCMDTDKNEILIMLENENK